jgi:hypothetical protein
VLQGFFPGDSVRQLSGPSANSNQLAEVFARFAPPGRGFEIYGEFGREDWVADVRDALLEPDHDAAYTVGFARAWVAADSQKITILRGEVLNSRISHLKQGKDQSPWYIHVEQANGHTERGQVLGSAGAFGGGASNVAVDRYTPAGRTTIRWDRIVRATFLPFPVELPVSSRTDVLHAIGVERARFIGRGELTATGTFVKEFNRYFASDARNVNVSVSYRLIR